MRQNSRYGDFSPDWLMEAIGNEYRARAALQALQGSVGSSFVRAQMTNNFILQFIGADTAKIPVPGELPTTSGIAIAVTPAQFFDFYKDRCSEHTFVMLELRAEDYLDKVTAEPTKQERIAFFNKYRGELPDPSKERPGFKEPRKVMVEFVALDATAPRISQAIPKVQAASQFLCISWGAIAGDPVSALAAATQPALAESMPLKEAVSEKMQANLSPYRPIEQWDFMPRDTSIYRPRPIVSALGVLAGNPDITTFAAALASVHQNVEIVDHQTRVPFLLQPWLTPFTPTMGNALGMPAFAYALSPKLPPEALYLAEASKTIKKRQREALFRGDVDQLQEKLAEIMRDTRPLGPKADDAKIKAALADARKHVDAWVKDRGLTLSATKSKIDEYSVLTTPELKPLNDVAKAEPDGTNSLSKLLFEMIDPRTAFGMSGSPFARFQPFRPQWFPEEPIGDQLDKPNHLIWVSEETESKPYLTLDHANSVTNGEMTKRVDRAWKLDKARALARAEADRIAARVRDIAKSAASNAEGVQRQLRDVAAEEKLRMIELENMALLKFQHGSTQATQDYQPPKIEKTQVLYPTPDFANQLLELRKQPLGGVTVLNDAPKAKFYVACEVARNVKTVDQFREVFVKTTATGAAQNPLYGYVLSDQRKKPLDFVRARRRADAKLEEKEAFKNREKKDAE
jgi:hypothetical protein